MTNQRFDSSVTASAIGTVIARPSRPGWPEVLLGGLVYLAAFGVVYLTLPLIPEDQQVLAGLAGLAISGLMGLAAFSAAVSLRIRRISVFGVRRVGWGWILIGAGAGVGCYVLGAVVSTLYAMASGDQENIQAGYQAAAAGGLLAYVGTLVFGAILTPIGEEFFFRGVLTNALGRYGAWVSVLGSAAVFAVAHGVNPVMPVAFVVGIVTALLFRKTGSVWPGIAVHAINNAAASTVPLIVASMLG